jgi:putative membrane protein
MRQLSRLSMGVAALALAACSSKDKAATDSTTATSTTSSTTTTAMDSTHRDSAGGTAASAQLSDANIVAKEITADSAEVALASYVRSHASDAGVKSYAALLVADHGKGEKEAKALASKLSITPQPAANDTTSREAQNEMSRLSSLKGHDLDTAFVAHSVQDHQADLADAHKAADAAQNADVKSFVQKTIPELQKHLDRAQALEKKLSSAKS